MLLVCPHCATSYQVEDSAVGPAGRSVRCTRCRTVWFAANTAALSGIAAAHRAEMAQFAGTASGAEEAVEPPPSPLAERPGERPAAIDAAEPDTEIRVVHDAPPLAQAQATNDPPAQPLSAASPAERPAGGDETERADIETVAARHAKGGRRRRRSPLQFPGWPTIILALAAIDMGLIGWRAEIVRLLPQTAPLYAAISLPVNVRGLVFSDVEVETESREGVRVLLVKGIIASAATRNVEVPRLRFALRSAGGTEIYAWTALPARSVLAPGETLAFESRLASPPPDTHDVLVRFFNRRDLQSGNEGG
jgi:predicted Zn finger-like uncharacterized protein